MNFTSEVHHFSPYTPQNPIDAMAVVGSQGQQELQQGIQKVQGYVDYLHGFDLAKDVTRDYVQGKIGSIKQAVGNVAGDFSDQRLTNQIGGLAGKIADDPIVQNGIMSTAAYRKGAQDIENSKKLDKDGKGGNYAVQNEWDFMTKASDWLNDNDYSTSFSASYTPHTDYMKRFTDAYKEIHPSSSLTQDQVRINDGSGQIEVLNEKDREGIDANEVARLWNTIASDPEVQKQISIDARYRYKDLGPEDMYNHLTDDYQRNVENINGKIKEIQQRAAVDKTLKPREIASAIQALRDQGSQYADQYKNLVGLIPGVGGNTNIQNLDHAKEAVFSLDLQSNLASTYSWSKSTDKIVDSPLWKAHMDQIKYELDMAKYGEDVRWHNLQFQKDLLELQTKASTKTTGKGTTLGGEGFTTTEDQIDKTVGEVGASTYYDKTKQVEGQLNDAIKSSIFNIANSQGIDNPFVRTAQGLQYNPNYPGGIHAAIDAGADLWTKSRQATIDGKAKDFVVSEFNKVDPLIRELNSRRTVAANTEANYKPMLDKIAAEFGSPIDTRMLDNWIVEKKAPGWEAAQKRLESMPDTKQFQHDLYGAASDIYTGTPQGVTALNASQSGKLEKQYKDLSKFLNNNKQLIPSLQKREDEFKNLQTAFNPTVTHLELKDTDKPIWAGKFQRLAEKYNLNTNNSDFMKWLFPKTSKEEVPFKGQEFNVVFDKNANEFKLRVSRGSDFKEIPVSERDVQDLGLSTRDDFWDKFGHDLQLTQNTKTDVNNRGIASAYILQQPSGSKYQVKYHLYGDGNGQYGLRLYVQDQKGKILADNATLGRMFNKDAIMSVVQNGFKDEEIEGILSKNR